MIALVATAAGTFAVDLETRRRSTPAEPFVPPRRSRAQPAAGGRGRRGGLDGRRRRRRPPADPRLVRRRLDLARVRPRPSARGARSRSRRPTPTRSLYAARNRLYVSRNGGVFWTALAVELPEIEALDLVDG